MNSIMHSGGMDPFAEMEAMMKRLPSMRGAFNPAMDIYETKEALFVEATLAGMKPEDVHVSIEDGVLLIKGESKKEREVDEKNYYRKEIRSGSFARRVALPSTVKADEITAEYEDGVLKITAPKKALPEPKKVEVQIKKGNK